MTILTILQYPDPGLKRRAIPVTDVKNPATMKVIADIRETLKHQQNCAGLAATQLDLPDPPAISIINLANQFNEKELLYLINPTIISFSNARELSQEGCMSVKLPPHLITNVWRSRKITVRTLTLEGKTREITAEGFIARCIQHECDHLEGIIYLDRLSPSERLRVEQKLCAK